MKELEIDMLGDLRDEARGLAMVRDDLNMNYNWHSCALLKLVVNVMNIKCQLFYLHGIV